MTMAILYLILMTGPLAAAAFLKKSNGMAWLLTALTIIFVLYAGALLGNILLPVYVIFVLCAVLWLAAGFRILQTRDFKGFRDRLLTPCNVIFTALFVFCAVTMRGMVIHVWDEFSHWAYSVQEMVLNDQLYTSALSNDMFKEYPPAMPLWQYFAQRISYFVTGKKEINGALLYGTSQVLAFSLFTPFLDRLEWKKASPLYIFAALVCIIGLPVIVYTNFYYLVYIDAFLGLLSGTVFAMIALKKWKKPLGAVTLALAEGALVLTKESGLLFAVVSLLYFAVLALQEKHRKTFHACYAAVLTVAAVKICWGIHINSLGISSNGIGIDLKALWNLISGRDPESFRHQVAANFVGFIFSDSLRLTPLRLPVSYFLVFILTCALSYAAYQRKKTSERLLLLVSEIVCILVYMIGLLMLYLFRFGEYGGLELLSAARYTKTLVLCLVMIAGACMLNRLGNAKGKKGLALLCAAFLLLPSWNEVYKHASGSNAQMTALQAERFLQVRDCVTEKVRKNEGERARIYFVTQENDNEIYDASRYYLRPYAVINQGEFHFGRQSFFGAYTVYQMGLEKWNNLLYNGYDYVYVAELDDYFITNFGDLFSGELKPNSLYIIEKTEGETVRLTLV
ncbi:MAG: hypothetical protein IKW00_06880 [Clostridia bacterium]|nr:hypothetical protein [Clostridia bacterium]